MTKIKIHELAKELDVSSKELINYMNEQNKDIKSHMSSLEDSDVEIIRKKYSKKESKAISKVDPDINPQTNEESKRPKKKSSITAVYNPQNSKQGGPKRGTGGGERPHRPASAQNVQRRSDVSGSHTEKAVDKAITKPAEPVMEPVQETVKTVVPKPVEKVQASVNESAAATVVEAKQPIKRQNVYADLKKQQEKRAAAQGKKVESTNTANRAPRNNQGYQKQDGERKPFRNRPQGDRPYENRPQGERSYENRPQGERTYENRSQGERKNGTFNRNSQKDNQGNRTPSNNYQGNRNNTGVASNRPGQRPRVEGDNRSGSGAAATTDSVRGKESRERAGNRTSNVKKPAYDKKEPKKKENFLNLEKKSLRKKPQGAPKQEEKIDEIKTVILPEILTIRDLAEKMKLQPSAIVKKLFLKGIMVTVNQEVDFDKASEIAMEFNFITEPEVKIDVIAELLKEDDESEDDMIARAPVVCVMGHVDHGKTSLLDAIRSTKVTDKEAGGITQHIGASVVSIKNQNITFLDTPGHEAFTAMRMRGANATDIAILVVAADDGVMPQTIEAINHAKAAGIEIIVAVNKIDKPSANIERVKQELSEYQLIPEDWGGSTIFVPVSAHTKEGIEQLLEMILLTAEILELKSNPKRNARGLVIEAQLDKGRGAVATILVQKGTLRVGEPIACGSCYGKVRAMIDDDGKRVKEAGPSMPVEILGLNGVPNAGEVFVSTSTEKEARSFAETFISEGKERLLEETKAKMSLDDLFSQIKSGNVKELPIIVKADVQGSVEAVKQSLEKLSNEEVMVKIIHGGVGAINESDVILASASNAIIIGFNVRPDATAKTTAEREGVDVRLYKVIYNAIEDVEAAMKGMLDPIFEEKVLGHAEVRQIFKASGIGNIAGSYILDGTFERGCKVRILREGKQIFEGELASLKRFKDDVKEVRHGYECGLVIDGFDEFEEFDQIEAYKMVEVPR